MKIYILLSIIVSFSYSVSSQNFELKNYKLSFSEKNICENHFDFISNENTFDSLYFYNKNIKDNYEFFYKQIHLLIDDKSNKKKFERLNCMFLNVFKNKNDSIFKSPKSYLNVLEIVYQSKKDIEKVFKTIKQKNEIDYPVTPMDWSFYLTNKNSIIIIFSEGYRKESYLYSKVCDIIEKNTSVVDKKFIIDSTKSID